MQAQTVLTGGVTITASGSYKLGANVATAVISADHVVLDLAGYSVNGQYIASCPVAASGVGNTCSGTPVGSPGISITGTDVTIRNGMIWQGKGDGITLSGSQRQDVTIEDVTISDFWGNCISATKDGLRLVNVSAVRCQGFGVNANNRDVIMDNVIASNNNMAGIIAGSGTLHKVTANSNGAGGVSIAGTSTFSDIVTKFNAGPGLIFGGAVHNAISSSNTGDGFQASSGTPNVIIDATSQANGGKGFNFPSTASCYFGLSTGGNIGAAISGGTALTGTTASCL